MNDLQAIVDALATTLARPVGVDDRRFGVVAYSAHIDSVDPVRLASILQREAPRAATEWLESLGISEVEDYLRVPANAELGMTQRVCVPIRFDGNLLGYLWLIEQSTVLTDRELQEVLRTATDLGVALYRVRMLQREDRERERDLVGRALGAWGDDPADAVDELMGRGLLARSLHYSAIVARAHHPDGGGTPDRIGVRLTSAVDQIRRSVAPGHLLVFIDGEVLAVTFAHDEEEEAGACARDLHARMTANLAGEEWRAVVGVGGSAQARGPDLARSFTQAVCAARLARQVPERGPVAMWDALGAYRVLAGIQSSEARELIPDALWTLLASPDAGTLVPTLACFLEHGGDARAAAEELYLHRSSLYARIRRIEEITALDLHAGDARLELHLGLRLWRLSGEPMT